MPMRLRLPMPAAMVYRGISGSAPAPTVSLAALWRSPSSRVAMVTSVSLVLFGCLLLTAPAVLKASTHPHLYAAAGGAAMNPEAIEKFLHGLNLSGVLVILGGIVTGLLMLSQKVLEIRRNVEAEKRKVLEDQIGVLTEQNQYSAADRERLRIDLKASREQIDGLSDDLRRLREVEVRELRHTVRDGLQDERSKTENAQEDIKAQVEAIAAAVAATPSSPSVTVNIDHAAGDVKP